MDSEEFSEYSDHWDNKQAQYLAKQKLKKTNPNPDMFKIEPEKPEKPDTEGVIDSSDFLNSLTKIEKVKAVTAKDGATWIFTISILGKTERIIISNRDLMKGSWIFEDLFKSRFGFFLPWELTKKPKKGQPNMWKRFQSYIEQICVEIEPSESTEWAECEKRLTSTHMKIGDTMNQRGFKRKGNPACRVGKKIVNPAWWFTEECLIEHGLNSGASKVPHVMEELL